MASRSDSFSRRRATPVRPDVPAANATSAARGSAASGAASTSTGTERERAAPRSSHRERFLAVRRPFPSERSACGTRPRAKRRVRLLRLARETAQRHASSRNDRARDRKAGGRVVAAHAKARRPVTASRRSSEAVQDTARRATGRRPKNRPFDLELDAARHEGRDEHERRQELRGDVAANLHPPATQRAAADRGGGRSPRPRQVRSPPRPRIASKRGDIGRSRIRALPSRT